MPSPERQHLDPNVTVPVVSAFLVDRCERDLPLVAIPRAETALVVRFGPSARGGLDVHAMGPRQHAHRKLVRAGQRTVMARLRLGAHAAVLGVRASELLERTIPLEELWGPAATRQLLGRLGDANPLEATAVLERAIALRLATARGLSAHARLALEAAPRLTTTPVSTVAVELGVSERHLRRVFRDAIGLNPKAFARLARFHRALDAAREDLGTGWAGIAASAGYYDQAHLIAEFREVCGVTPRALLGELARERPEPPGRSRPLELASAS